MVTLEQRIRYAPSFVRFAMVGALATIVDCSAATAIPRPRTS
jgi:putative flippase GtrA